MKAIFKEVKNTKFNVNHRKDNAFYMQYTALVFKGAEASEAVTLRLYATNSRTYCCLWTGGSYRLGKDGTETHRNGSGTAGGYGYHRGSAAACEAIYNAGIELDEDISGRGDSSIVEAVEAIARAIYPEKKYHIHIIQAYA